MTRRLPGFSSSGLVALIALIAIAVISSLVWFGSVETTTVTNRQDVHLVDRGDFMITIPASGELSANNLMEIRNPLETSGMIMEIVREGATVKKGDVLVRFNNDAIEEKIKDDEDRLVDAQNKLVIEEQSMAIAVGTMQSELEKATLKIEIAELALQGWSEGEDVKSKQDLELALETAEINSERLAKRFEEAKALVDQGFISQDEYQRDRIAMIEAKAKVKNAMLDKDVYTKFTSKQDEKQKNSDVDQATAERKRVSQRHEAEMVTQRANLASAQTRLESMQERLSELREQLDLCTITAPTDGLVVYKTSLSSGRRGGDDNPPTVGTNVSPNELIILLPDTSQMIAEVKVSEALSGRIKKDQFATVYSETYPNMPIGGQVQSVSVLAESGGWRDPNRRDYTVRIVLNVEDGMNLKPSMRCRSEIQLGKVEDALSVPIQSVFRSGPTAYVYVSEDGGWAQRKVGLGRASELAVEVINGVEIGDEILLREPKIAEIVSRLTEEKAGRPDTAKGAPGTPGRPMGGGKPAGAGQGGYKGASSGRPSGGGGRPSGTS